MSIKPHISTILAILQLLLYLLTVALIGKLVFDLTLKDSVTICLLATIIVPWYITVWLTHKHKPKFYQRKVKYVIAPFLKAILILTFLTAILSYTVNKDLIEVRLLVLSILLYSSFEALIVIAMIYMYNKTNSQVVIVDAEENYPQNDLNIEYFQKGQLRISKTLAQLKNYPEGIITKLYDHIELKQLNKEINVGIIRNPENHEFNDDRIQLSIIDAKLNDRKDINKVLATVYCNTISGGYIVVPYEELEEFENRFISDRPRIIKPFIRIHYYIFHRAFSNTPVLKRIHCLLTRGEKKVLSRAEVLGRISFCGFDILAEENQSGISFVIARKTKTPSNNPSPSFYPIVKLNRVGLHGKSIKIHKIRSMYPYSEFIQKKVYDENNLTSTGKMRHDFRITKPGRIYRKYWIDELPQILDWLRGDIKLVGIRAMSHHFFSLYPKDYQDYFFKVKPGIISPIFDEKTASFDDIVNIEKEYLMSYLENPLRTDIKYFFHTFSYILKGVRSK